MKFKWILFDLDGTLLSMDQDVFTRTYFKLLARYLAPMGYDPETLIQNVWAGTKAMVKNDGSMTNADAFWATFSAFYGRDCRQDEPEFARFYQTDFQQAASVCRKNPEAACMVDFCKQAGYQVALATNPLFPAVATESRIRWAGLDPSDFALYTTYDNSSHCKPHPGYYRDILAALGARAEECLMVGNDAKEDMIAETVGMSVFLLTDCLVNRENADISRWPHGSFADLRAYLSE